MVHLRYDCDCEVCTGGAPSPPSADGQPTCGGWKCMCSCHYRAEQLEIPLSFELKVCGFCSHKVIDVVCDDLGWYYGVCTKCGAKGPTTRTSSEAAQAWNTRTSTKDEQLEAKCGAMRWALIKLQIGSCSCLVKSPDIKYHRSDCRYRIASEGLSDTAGCEILERLVKAERDLRIAIKLGEAYAKCVSEFKTFLVDSEKLLETKGYIKKK